MTLEELQEQVDKDLKINDTELDLESLKTPQLHNKYLKHYNNFKLLLTRRNLITRYLKEKNGNTIQVRQVHKYINKNLSI